MKRPWWIAAPLAWAAVVAIVAAVAWWVIDAAGQGVLAESSQDPTTAASTPAGPTRPSGEPSDPTSSAKPSPSASRPPSGSTDPDDPNRTTRTWQGEAGILRVSCTGSSLRLDGASPHDGYEVDKTEYEGGNELEVKFRSTDGAREVEIHVVCRSGVPGFTVEQSEDDD